MKNGKFTKKPTMPKGKRLMALVLSMLLLGVTIGSTIAYLIDNSNALTNTFLPTEVEISIKEDFTNNVKENVQILNPNSDKAIPAYIRARIVVTWQDADGNVLGQEPDEGIDYSMSINLTQQAAHTGLLEKRPYKAGQWKQSGDYYYWSEAVEPGLHTGILITEAKQLKAAPVAGYKLNIAILASAVQSVPNTVVKDYWGSTAAGILGLPTT